MLLNCASRRGIFVETNRQCFRRGIRDGMPIALGYFAVAFTLGIAAKNAGFSALQAMVESLTNNASAGEYAVFSLAAAGAGYWEVAVMTLVANARYLLMSCSLSQKLPPETSLAHRMLVAFDVTDEIFGISIAYPGRLNPWYTYGAMAVSIPGWGLGTFLGVAPWKKDKVVLGLVLLSFAASFALANWPLLAGISPGIKTILLTVVLSLGAAVLFPVQDEERGEGQA